MVECHQVSFLVVHRLKELALVAPRCQLFLVEFLWMIFDLLDQRSAVFLVLLPKVQPQFNSTKVRPSTLPSGEVTVLSYLGFFPCLVVYFQNLSVKPPEQSPPIATNSK